VTDRRVQPLAPRCGPVVDADGHVVEPVAAWKGLPDVCRPDIASDGHGYEHVTVGGTEILAVPLGTLARPGSRFDDPSEFRPLAEAQPGGSDPVARLADMDTEGIDQAVLYPTIGLYFSAVPDPSAAARLAASYNDWLAAYCSADPARLFGAAMLPLQDPQAAARELRRAVTELGFVAGFVRPNPCLGRSLCHQAYEPLWDTAEDLGVPIGIHEGSSVIVPTLAADRPFNPLVLHALSHPFEEMLACAQLIAFGVMERHPDLNFIFLESSGGWVPFWLERLDEQVSSFGGYCPDMTLTPTEYFARQCAVSFEVDERTLPALVPFVGVDRIVWGSDYPHHDATFPGAVDALRATVAPCPTATQARVLGLNARGLYRLPSRRSGPAGLVDDYFAAVTAQNAGLLSRLFAPDAVLDVDGEQRVGLEDVLAYYDQHTFTYEDFRPSPGVLRVEGSSVTVEIDVHLGGADSVVRDVFETEGDRITTLRVRGFDAALRAAEGSPHPHHDPAS
jgi:predicted TIM-barrel fold metal-dependent hydrolase